MAISTTRRRTTGEPWQLISTMSSVVYECGAANRVATTSSMRSAVSMSSNSQNSARFGSRVRLPDRRNMCDVMDLDSGPARRTTPKPPRPGGVEMATMVSSRCKFQVSCFTFEVARVGRWEVRARAPASAESWSWSGAAPARAPGPTSKTSQAEQPVGDDDEAQRHHRDRYLAQRADGKRPQALLAHVAEIGAQTD